jgi:hypothetical protein
MNVSGTPFALAWSLWLRLVAAVLCLAVATIHVLDQGGLAIRSPAYVGVGYLVLEVAATVAAVLLVRSGAVLGWLLSVGAGAGPLAGYVLSRGPGLPGYTDDIGNWAEPLGLLSIVVEGLLLALALAAIGYARSAPTAVPSAGGATASGDTAFDAVEQESLP